MRSSRFRILCFAALAAAACSKKKSNDQPAPASPPPAGSAAPAPAEPPPAAPASGSDGSGAAGSAAAGSATAGSADATAGSAAGSGPGSGGVKFADLSDDEKADFMKKRVMPKMKPLFQAFDKVEFANFNCKTCHGKDPKASKYEMPNPDLPKLDFAKLQAGKQEPKMAKWMADVVKPEMAKLLQMPEMTESNPDGFGCLHCHEQKK